MASLLCSQDLNGVSKLPVRRYVPIARPEVWEEEPYSARLRWHRAYIPRFYRVPLRYRIEMQEAGDVATDWKPVATEISTPDVTVNELSPRKDYNFRIRGELENGDLTDPTPPIQYHRSKVPMSKEPFALAEYKPVEYDHVSLNRTYVDHLTKYVPPRLPIDKPDMVVLDPETVELSWRSASLPESIRHSSNLTYTIEVRNPPTFEWRELISGLKVLNHTIKDLHNRIDYVFRIRAWNEYGCSEPSLPVSLYRPIDYNDYEFVDEDEEFEHEWELRFGQQVPPKLPMDTPKVHTQTDTSIWFTWQPARIPAYATQTPITYVVEMREPPNTSWRRDVTGLVDCQYVREGLDPKRDYHIRVKAETEFGTSEPTLPIMIQRSRGSRPGSRLSSVEREMKDEVTVSTSYLDNLTSTGPPRMTSSRPQVSNVEPTSLTLSWTPSRVPSYVKSLGVSYIIEKREPPGHVWCVVARDVAETSYQVLGLIPEQDYMLRVRAKNEHGISDPTLPVSVYRERDDYVPQKIRSRSGSRDSISAYLSLRARRSSSIDVGSNSGGLRTPDEEVQDNIPRQPEYIETTYDTQYGVEGKKGKITLQVKGFPLPTVHWYFGEEKLKYGDHYNAFITPSGGITLEIKNVRRDSVGQYKCYAENEHGAAVKVVTFDLAEPPTVLEPLIDQSLLSYNDITLSCKVDGYPNPSIKWMKDWKPLAESSRIKIKQSETEDFYIEITNGLVSDSGVYACVVENAAGKVTTACRLTVEDTATPREVILKNTPIEEHYTVLEEIRRGEHGVTRRVIELSTGISYEAEFIYMRNRAQKNFFLSEFEVMRTVKEIDGVLKIHNAFETERSLIFVLEPLSGVPILEKITADGNWTEADVAFVIKSLLNMLMGFEDLRVLYLDMKPSNIRLCGEGGKNVKLVNFAMSRIQDLDEDVMHNYGTVGYASPEQVTNDVITTKSDTWGVGVLAYILLTGNHPFPGETDSEILNKTAECDVNLDDKDFEKLSLKAKDFVQKLLVKQPSMRMSVAECIKHPFMKAEGTDKLNIEKLQKLCNDEKAIAAARQVQTTAVLQSLSKIRHGTAALYQPAIDTNSGEIIFPDSDEYGDYLDEDAWYEWQLQYCDDPDSQYFPLMDKNFTVRESKHTAEKRDLEKDEIEEPEGNGSIFFQNKIQPVTFSIGDDVSFMCTVVSPNEKPVVTWYRDETLLSEREAYRTEQLYNEETGIAQLIVQNAKDYDGAVYKCVARNKEARVSCEARMLLGDKPSKPGRPVVIQTSGSEAFLTWSNPVTDGNSYILGYRVDFRKQGTTTWVKGPYMNEEYAMVSGLLPKTSYVFRVSCHNKYGTSPFSFASIPTTTLDKDAPSITISGYLQPLLQFSSFTKQQLILPAESRRPSLSVTPDAKVQKGNPNDFYDLGETVSKGKYGEYKLCTSKASNRQCVVKVMPFTKETHVAIKREFEILKNLRQLHIITVLDAYIMKEYCYVVFEHLSGLNIVQYLCLQKSYKEETVARVVKQILDALQYLEMFGVVHLNLQPSSVAMTTRRRLHIKLRDFTIARKLKDGKVENMTPAGYPDFVAPEVIKGEAVAFPADIWSLGALTFTLLSGVSAFGGADVKETLSNILFDRYKASDMYDNVTKESVKFINKLLRRLPKNRPSVNKCLKSRWLQLGDNMLSSRTTRAFPTERLRDFLLEYTTRRADTTYMDITSVPVEELPKPTPGPIVQPILSDKVANRYEFKPKTTARIEREEGEKSLIEHLPVSKKSIKKEAEGEREVETISKEEDVSQVESEKSLIEHLPVSKKSIKKEAEDEIEVETISKEEDVSQVESSPQTKIDDVINENEKNISKKVDIVEKDSEKVQKIEDIKKGDDQSQTKISDIPKKEEESVPQIEDIINEDDVKAPKIEDVTPKEPTPRKEKRGPPPPVPQPKPMRKQKSNEALLPVADNKPTTPPQEKETESSDKIKESEKDSEIKKEEQQPVGDLKKEEEGQPSVEPEIKPAETKTTENIPENPVQEKDEAPEKAPEKEELKPESGDKVSEQAETEVDGNVSTLDKVEKIKTDVEPDIVEKTSKELNIEVKDNSDSKDKAENIKENNLNEENDMPEVKSNSEESVKKVEGEIEIKDNAKQSKNQSCEADKQTGLSSKDNVVDEKSVKEIDNKEYIEKKELDEKPELINQNAEEKEIKERDFQTEQNRKSNDQTEKNKITTEIQDEKVQDQQKADETDSAIQNPESENTKEEEKAQESEPVKNIVEEQPQVEEEAIAPVTKASEEAAVKASLDESVDISKKENNLNELSNVLAELDQKLADRKKSEDFTDEPIVEDDIVSEQKSSVESVIPEESTNNAEEKDSISAEPSNTSNEPEVIDTSKEEPIPPVTETKPKDDKEIIESQMIENQDNGKAEPSQNNDAADTNKDEKPEPIPETSNDIQNEEAESKDSVDVENAATTAENINDQSSDDSEIQKLEKDAVPEKVENPKDDSAVEKAEIEKGAETEIDVTEKDAAEKDSDKKEDAVKAEEPDEDKIADLCTAIDDALMFC